MGGDTTRGALIEGAVEPGIEAATGEIAGQHGRWTGHPPIAILMGA
jgi:hypothetical protein